MTSNFVDAFDQFSYKPHLFINGRARYKSFIPAILGFMTYLASLSIAIFFLIDALNRRNPIIISNDDPNYYPLVNLSQTPIQVSLTQGLDIIYDESYFTFSAFFLDISVDPSKPKEQITKYKRLFFENCLQEDYNKFGKKILNNTFCLNPEKNNITLYGRYGDAYNGFSVLNIDVNQCVNSTKSMVVCKPKQFIDEYLKSLTFGLGLKVNYLNHQNTTDPFIQDFKLMAFHMSNTIFKKYFVSFKNAIYTSDLGMIFEDKIVQYNYIYGSQELNVDLKIGTILSPAAFGQVTLTTNSIANEYKRSFTKLQTVLANA
jgi:hypothetical protein